MSFIHREQREQDMTTGNIAGLLLRFALPLLLANLLQAAYAMADMAVVGHFVGEAGLAAVANASIISFILNAAGMGVSVGGTVLIAQYTGAGDRQGQKDTARALFFTAMLAALLAAALGIGLCEPVYRLLRIAPQALADACAYTYIISAGAVAVFGYNAACSLLRGLGDARTPLYFVALAAILNVALDLLLVGPLGMGTRGAAVATVVSQGCSLALAALYLKRHELFRRERQDRRRLSRLRPDWGACLSIARLGVPFAFQMMVVNVGYLLIIGQLNRYGMIIAAAAGIGFKICTFAVMPCWSVGQALVTMVGQNVGAGRTARAAAAVKTAVRLNVLITGLVVLLINVWAVPLLGVFSPDPEVVRQGVFYLRICCSAGTVVYSVMYAYDSFLTGIGAAGPALFNALLDGTFVRLPLAWLLSVSLGLGFTGVYAAQALSPLLPALVGMALFRFGPWKTRRPLISV